MSESVFPTNMMLEEAILEALERLNGQATTDEINTLVITILDLSDEIVHLEDENGVGTKLDYRLRWCRTNLKNKNKIVNVKRGVWRLA